MTSMWAMRHALLELEKIKSAWCSLGMCCEKRCGPCRPEGIHSFFLIGWDVPFHLYYKCKVYTWPSTSPNLNIVSNMISIVISTHIYYAPLSALEYNLLNQLSHIFLIKDCSWSVPLYTPQFSRYCNSVTHLNSSTWLCDLDFEFAACFDTTLHYVSWLCRSVWQCHWVIKKTVRSEVQAQLKTLLPQKSSSPWIRNRVLLFTGGSALVKVNHWCTVNPQWVTTTFSSFRTKSQREMWLASCWHRWIHTHLGSGILSGIKESNVPPQPLT